MPSLPVKFAKIRVQRHHLAGRRNGLGYGAERLDAEIGFDSSREEQADHVGELFEIRTAPERLYGRLKIVNVNSL